ncbi:hypothetical protein I6F37_44020, partial [Bradyrhizobium sp. NBAIM08]|nr:hypothetical protein [Bradyrhizobium sp. NBAIM08]
MNGQVVGPLGELSSHMSVAEFDVLDRAHAAARGFEAMLGRPDVALDGGAAPEVEAQ